MPPQERAPRESGLLRIDQSIIVDRPSVRLMNEFLSVKDRKPGKDILQLPDIKLILGLNEIKKGGLLVVDTNAPLRRITANSTYQRLSNPAIPSEAHDGEADLWRVLYNGMDFIVGGELVNHKNKLIPNSDEIDPSEHLGDQIIGGNLISLRRKGALLIPKGYAHQHGTSLADILDEATTAYALVFKLDPAQTELARKIGGVLTVQDHQGNVR